ncbi:hypothetical protein H0H87_004195 [Tephrocybe sp. NHM501043]|nr:hypothetical protein H0H87_004195 [Tephrocybe sp. NHM501043]
MLPGFGGPYLPKDHREFCHLSRVITAPESKAFIPIFQKVGGELTAQWTDMLASTVDQTAEFNVATWLSRATMDSIGEGPSTRKSDTLGSPPKSSILMQTMLPVWALGLMSKFSRRRSLVHARHTANLANEVTRALVKSKASALLQGKHNKDILSLLGQLKPLRTILLAGHETSATTLCWVLLELARNPEFQHRLRAEIRATENATGRKYSSFTANDLDSMQYLAAILKESMRFHPALYQNYRQAAKDDVLPLSTPIQTTSGEHIDELPIPKGMKVILSIAAYQRNKAIFGEDADTFNPERWLRKTDTKKGPTLGVYGNLLTFAGGVRTCIGWRFALYEVQTLTVEIINNFELLPTPQLERLRREACLVMLPTLEGEEYKGENLPLRVRLAEP